MSNSQLHYFTGMTLVDITATGVMRNHDEFKRNQQRNWETVIQTIGLLAQPIEMTSPIQTEFEMSETKFGEFFAGKHKVWVFGFSVEHADVFSKGDDPVGRLHDVFSEVPIIAGLDESHGFILPIFHCGGSIRNIYFEPWKLF